MRCACFLPGLLSLLMLMIGCASRGTDVRAVSSPPSHGPGALYVCNRPPLLPSPLVKLPIGSIEPAGWLRHQLELQARGMSGRLPEISPWCRFEGNAWVQPEGGHSGWEEMPYWLKGFGDLGYVLKDQNINQLSRRWIEAILATQREDGWFGPRALLTSLQGKPDLWPNMIVLNILQSYHEATGDQRVLPFMTRYFRWQLACPDADFLAGYWPKMRAGDNIESIYWLYNRTGEEWLLDVAEKCYRHMARWDQDVINWHGVNISQGFRAPAVYYMQSHDPAHLEATVRNYDKVMAMYGQFPGGMFVADENARPGYDDPRGGAETCSIVEFMHSFEMLTKITGDTKWSDRCEDVAFNSFPAALTPDLKALHYITSANQVQLDKENKSPGIQNDGTMFAYSPFERYRCCQHNVAHGWPYYAQELWLATQDRGLCASLYAPCTVTARVADGIEIVLVEATDYPFSEQVKLTVARLRRPVRFPLYLRIPGWCSGSELKINGQKLPSPLTATPRYAAVERQWQAGDVLELRLPMSLRIRTWKQNHNAVSIDYGPLSFSLKIGERWVPSGSRGEWSEFEVFPTTPWNYGLVIDEKNPTDQFEVRRRPGPLPDQPFTPENAPIEIRAKARRIPQWKLDELGLVGLLQDSPAYSSEPLQTVSLIPMGCARLRISAFPVAADSPSARPWKDPPRPPLASHCWKNDTTLALNDGLLPRNSGDQTIPRFTWWDRRGTVEWVQYDFERPRTVRGLEVYWFNDQASGGHCRQPQSWEVLFRQGDKWQPVTNCSPCGTLLDQFNKVTFDPVTTSSLRLQVKLMPEFSAGILEWRVLFAD